MIGSQISEWHAGMLLCSICSVTMRCAIMRVVFEIIMCFMQMMR